jgi:hypothetical protein
VKGRREEYPSGNLGCQHLSFVICHFLFFIAVGLPRTEYTTNGKYSLPENVLHHEETKRTKKQGKIFVFFVSSVRQAKPG